MNKNIKLIFPAKEKTALKYRCFCGDLAILKNEYNKHTIIFKKQNIKNPLSRKYNNFLIKNQKNFFIINFFKNKKRAPRCKNFRQRAPLYIVNNI